MATQKVKAEVTGTVWQIFAQPGQQLAQDETILVLESMKMEIPVVAPAKGTLKAILVQEREEVTEGQDVATIET